MRSDEPLAFFITWTIYGTHLQGDERGWRRRGKGWQERQPRLAEWRQERLKYPILLLSCEQRNAVEDACRHHCDHRGWKLWAVNARSNHVHAVVTAGGNSGKTVRDQLKADCTRDMREKWPAFLGRQVWTVGGDWECINGEDDLEAACQYVLVAQDRKSQE